MRSFVFGWNLSAEHAQKKKPAWDQRHDRKCSLLTSCHLWWLTSRRRGNRRPFPELRAFLPQWRAQAAIPRWFHALSRERLPENRDSAEEVPIELGGQRVEGPSSACLLELGVAFVDLNERIVRMNRFYRLVEQSQRVWVLVLYGERRLHRRPQATQPAESMVH